MRLAPLVPKPDPAAPNKRKRQRPAWTSYAGSGAPPIWDTVSNESPDLSRGEWSQAPLPVLLPKLEVGAANDPLEREADAVADRVMRMPAPARAGSDSPALEPDAELDNEVEDEELSEAPVLGAFASAAALPSGPGFVAQRKCASCEAGEEEIHRSITDAPVMRTCETCEDEDEIRRACASCDAKEDEPIRRKPSESIWAKAAANDRARHSLTNGHNGCLTFGEFHHEQPLGPTPHIGSLAVRRANVAVRGPLSAIAFDAFLNRTPAQAPDAALAGPPQDPYYEPSQCDGRVRTWVADWLVIRESDTCRDKSELRRACASCEAKGEDAIRPEPFAGWGGGPTSEVFSEQLRARVRAGGLPLPNSARDFLEPRLGVRLGHLRIHEDTAAGKLAERISARAFTLGQDIFFAPGQLRVTSREGMRLLAHEVAHTLQTANAPMLRRAPPEPDNLEPATAVELDYGEDLLEQDEKFQNLVRLTRYHLLNIIREMMRPGEVDVSEEGEPPQIEEFSSTLDYFEVPANLKNAAEAASKRFVIVTEYLDSSSDRSAVLMSQWLDAAAELIGKLEACARWIKKNGGKQEDGQSYGEYLGETYGRRLRVLKRRVQNLRKSEFFSEGADLEKIAREVEVAEKTAEVEAQLEEQLGHLRKEYHADSMSKPEAELRAELGRLERELSEEKSKILFPSAVEASQTKWAIRVVETKIEILTGLIDELDFVAGPTVTDRAQTLAKTVMKDLDLGARRVAAVIEQAVASKPIDAFELEVVIDTFRWVDFYDEGTTKSERLAPEVLLALRDPATTLAALIKHERGEIVVGWLSPERRPELRFAMLAIAADPGYDGESQRSPLAASSYLKKLSKGARPHAVMKATALLSKSGALTRYAAFEETRHLLTDMVYQLWSDGYSHKYVNAGDTLADAIASVSTGVGARVPVVGSIHVERIVMGDAFLVTMNLRDFAEATEVLGASGETADAMWRGGGLRVSPTDLVNLLTEDGRVTVPALKLIEVGAKADRGMIKAGAQDFARWSGETADSVGAGIEARTKARLEWLEGLVDDSAEQARALAREHLDGENLRRLEAVIGAVEWAGDGMVGAVTAAEGLRVGVQTAAVDSVGSIAELGGNVVAGAAEFGSDALEGRALADFAVEYDQLDHKVRVAIDAAPEIANGFYDAAVEKLKNTDGFEQVFIVSKVGGQIVFEIATSFVGGSATKAGKVDDLADLSRLADAADAIHDADRAADLVRLSERAKELANNGLRRSADHLDAIDMGVRRHLDSATMAKVKGDIPSGVKVWVDQRLPEGTVRVELDMPNGVVDPSTIRIVAGPNSSPRFIGMHARTILDLKRFSGWQGRARKLVARILELLDLGPDAARREALIEAQLEVRKLQRIVDSDLERLAKAEAGSPKAQQIVDELEQAWAQLDEWKRIVDGDAALPAAKGYVAGEGDRRDRLKLAAADTDAKPRDIDDVDSQTPASLSFDDANDGTKPKSDENARSWHVEAAAASAENGGVRVVAGRPVPPRLTTPTRYRWANPRMNKGNYVDAHLKDGVLWLEIRSNGPNELRVGGSQLLDDVFAHFGRQNIHEFEAHWVPHKNWDTNYREFMNNRRTMDDVTAAWKTWTGRQMRKRDFKNAKLVEETPDCITVRFF